MGRDESNFVGHVWKRVLKKEWEKRRVGQQEIRGSWNCGSLGSLEIIKKVIEKINTTVKVLATTS